jgi:glycosyltransferase involved in cell wall biosynthesis
MSILKFTAESRTSKSSLHILQVNTSDIGGGAEKIAWNLFQSYKELGYQSTLAVDTKRSNDPNVFCIQDSEYRNPIARFFISISSHIESSMGKISTIAGFNEKIKLVGEPKRVINRLKGHEDFDYPGSLHILDLIEDKTDILHCHNLHGNYFDLRALIELSKRVPVVLTLHDAWLLSGHCAHSFECEKWKIGCGNCPDLTIYPRISKDATLYNWQRKKEIFEQSRFYVVTPCQWLMEKVNKSILKTGVIDSCIIPNGVNTKIFKPYSKVSAREELGLHPDEKIVLFAANGIQKNIWKDYKTLKSSLTIISANNKKVLCIALGENAPSINIGSVEIRFIPYQRDPGLVARYYQAADVYVHPSRADTFPNTVLEALACGTPVVASKVGGIPEQIIEGKTGYLVPEGDEKKMAEKIICLLENENLKTQIGREAAEDAIKRFSLERMVDDYLTFYEIILKNKENFH